MTDLAARARRLALPLLTLLARTGLIAIGAALVSAHLATHAQILQLATDAAPIIAGVAWSFGQKVWADHCLQLAIAAPAGLARPPATAPPSTPPDTAQAKKDPSMSESADLVAGIASSALQAFEKAAPGVLASLPEGTRQDLDTALNGATEAAKTALDTKIAAERNRLPPWLEGMAGDIEALLDKGLDIINQEAQAKAAPYLAGKQQLAAAAGDADPGSGQ